jgi:uncharacterized CHY-type Zn-finger protein
MSYKFEQHLDEESLELYAFGRLAEERAELLEEHLLICEECRTRLDTTERYMKAMARGSLKVQKEPLNPGLLSHVSGWFRWPAMVWAPAAAALCVILAVSALNMRRGEPILPPVAVSLTAFRAEAEVVQAHHPLILHLETRGLLLNSPTVQVTLVDANGKKLEESTAAFGPFVDFQTRRPLQPGVYYARILKPGSVDSAREFALDVR